MNYDKALEMYGSFVDQCPRFERKGKTMPYTSANGHMFSILNKDGELGIRFSKEVQENYIEKHNTSIIKSHGAIMRGYILITEYMMNEKDLVPDLLNESYDYVMSLKKK